MQKVYFKLNHYLYVVKAHPTNQEIFFLFAKSTTGGPDYFLGRMVDGCIEETADFRRLEWHIQKGAERLFVMLVKYGRPVFDALDPFVSVHTPLMYRQHSTKPKPDRNREIVLRRKEDPKKWSYRRLGGIYNLHWTTVESIIDRYSKIYSS